MPYGRNNECCSFRLHDMLENVKIVTTRLGLPYLVATLCIKGLYANGCDCSTTTKKSLFYFEIDMKY